MYEVRLHPELQQELVEIALQGVYGKLGAMIKLLKAQGVQLSFPYAKPLDAPQGTQPLMNLRFTAAGGVWRVPYCLVGSESGGDESFLLLAIVNKRGVDGGGKQSRRFYEDLVHKAQQRLETDPATVV